MILKPDKSAEEASSYRPISLLLILSKIWKKLLLKSILQFGFRRKHSTFEKVNRVYETTAREAIKDGEYCTVVFLDASQAFDKVWHPGLLYKIKRLLPLEIYKILYSYLADNSPIVLRTHMVQDLRIRCFSGHWIYFRRIPIAPSSIAAFRYL